jgi:hypothetical protein
VNPLIKRIHRASWRYARADGWSAAAGRPAVRHSTLSAPIPVTGRATQGLDERVAEVADYGLPGRGRKSMQRTAVSPRGFRAPRDALSTCGLIWLTHRAILP